MAREAGLRRGTRDESDRTERRVHSVVRPRYALSADPSPKSVEGSEEAGSGQNLAQLISAQPHSSLPLLFLCGDSRRPELPQTLVSRGVPFVELAIYATRPHEQLGIGIDALQRLHSMVFFSPAGARTVQSLLPSSPALSNAKLYAIGPTTAAELSKLGFVIAGVAKKPTPAALVEAVRSDATK